MNVKAYESVFGCSVIKVPNPSVSVGTNIGEIVIMTTEGEKIKTFLAHDKNVSPKPVKRTLYLTITDQELADEYPYETYLQQIFNKDLLKVVKRVKDEVQAVFYNSWMETFYITEPEIFLEHQYDKALTDYKLEYFFCFFARLGGAEYDGIHEILWDTDKESQKLWYTHGH